MDCSTTQRFTFQWHITDVCNYRCKHCYQSEYTERGVGFDKQLLVLEKITDFVNRFKKDYYPIQPHINFTGGEPFLRSDFLDLLTETRTKNIFSFGILSNGYLTTPENLQTLQRLNPAFVQLSLEGNPSINDMIRGDGAFRDVVNAIKAYHQLQIPVVISFTANAENYRYFSDVVAFAKKHKVYKVWTDRYLPISKSDELRLTKEQTRDFFNLILKEQQKNKTKTIIASNRALQFLVTGGMPYKCVAGTNLFTIMPKGEIYPCRRLPVSVGNIFKDDLMDIYRYNDFIKQIHQPENQDKTCLSCYYKNSCNGGLKCLTYAVTGKLDAKDPDCWL